MEIQYKSLGQSTKKVKAQTSGLYDQWGRSGVLGRANAALNSLRWTMVNVGFAMAAVGLPLAMLIKKYQELMF